MTSGTEKQSAQEKASETGCGCGHHKDPKNIGEAEAASEPSGTAAAAHQQAHATKKDDSCCGSKTTK